MIVALERLTRTPASYPDCPGRRVDYPEDILRVTDELGVTQLAAIYEDGLVGWELGPICEDDELLDAWRELRAGARARAVANAA